MELMTSWERKGRQEGRQEGRLATIQKQLRVLLGKLTPAQERNLECLQEAQLAELLERVREGIARYDAKELNAFDLDDVIHRLGTGK